jgi:uncharacterized protein
MSVEKKHYFLKLIPPRPDFSATMTEQEKMIMQEHIVFWQELMARNICVVYGPVFDPDGAYGIGIIEVEDEATVKDIQKNDPSVKKGVNRIEIFPMKAVTR